MWRPSYCTIASQQPFSLLSAPRFETRGLVWLFQHCSHYWESLMYHFFCLLAQDFTSLFLGPVWSLHSVFVVLVLSTLWINANSWLWFVMLQKQNSRDQQQLCLYKLLLTQLYQSCLNCSVEYILYVMYSMTFCSSSCYSGFYHKIISFRDLSGSFTYVLGLAIPLWMSQPDRHSSTVP